MAYHQDFTPEVEHHVEDFEAADEAMTRAVIGALTGQITVAQAEYLIALVIGELQERSTQWAIAVLPAVVVDAGSGVSGLPTYDDGGQQKAALELATNELTDAMHNTAVQMGRDAHRQIREGLRIQAEDQFAEVPS